MLMKLGKKIKKDWRLVVIGVGLYILGNVLSRVWAAASAVTQPIIKGLSAPFIWMEEIAPIQTSTYTPNPFAEWTYILFTFCALCIFLYGAYRVLFVDDSEIHLSAILCEEEVARITKRIEANPNSITSDEVLQLLKKFEDGFISIFSVGKSRDFLCVWVYPEELEEGAHFTNKWHVFCTDKSNPEKYVDIIQTGVLKQNGHTHFLSDLKSYNTDAQEFAFIKNIGEFRFGVGVLLMESNKMTEANKKNFTVSASLIHHISRLDKHIMSVV